MFQQLRRTLRETISCKKTCIFNCIQTVFLFRKTKRKQPSFCHQFLFNIRLFMAQNCAHITRMYMLLLCIHPYYYTRVCTRWLFSSVLFILPLKRCYFYGNLLKKKKRSSVQSQSKNKQCRKFGRNDTTRKITPTELALPHTIK